MIFAAHNARTFGSFCDDVRPGSRDFHYREYTAPPSWAPARDIAKTLGRIDSRTIATEAKVQDLARQVGDLARTVEELRELLSPRVAGESMLAAFVERGAALQPLPDVSDDDIAYLFDRDE